MTEPTVPPIPAWLAHSPTVGGLVVPWVTPRTTRGQFLLGSVHYARMRRALLCRWCGVCGRPLDEGRLVLLMRQSDMPRRCTNEPALHPQCAAYTAAACPMVGGHRTHYRSSPLPLDSDMVSAPDASARQGAPAEPWFAVWLPSYRVIVDHGNLAASYASIQPLATRPIANQPDK